MDRRTLLGLIVTASTLAFACAVGTTTGVQDDAGGNPPDASVGDSAACPQFDLQSDPKHCGTCTTVCNSASVCSKGACKASCDTPLVKCAGDGGLCADLSKDPGNCGTCGTLCSAGDAGALEAGNNGNPDAGINFGDAGYDGGAGWTLGTATCAASKCGVTCPGSTTQCSDGICYDTQNFHDRCGDCNTACASDTEWCTQGHCCGTGKRYCNTACADVLSDKNNCGTCGNVCGSGMNCANGVCKTGVTYTAAFPATGATTAQCTQWQAFIASLGSGYTSVTLSGTNDPVGLTCNVPATVNALATALKNQTPYFMACNGHNWSNCNRYNDELWVDAPTVCSGSNCPNPGYMLRACFSSGGNTGGGYQGVKTATCGGPAQTITLTFN